MRTDAAASAGEALPHSGALPLVTIGMPVFNGGSMLRRALDSLVAQDYPALEICIHDNCSTDSTEAICREFVARDPRVKYRRNETNIGAMGNFKQALGAATGPYFMWAAHDDFWSPDYVRRLAAALQKNPDAVLAAGTASFLALDGAPMGTSCAPDGKEEPCRRLYAAHATHWLYGLFLRERLVELSDTLWVHNPWGGDMVWLVHLTTANDVAGDDAAIKYTTVKPSGFRPKSPRDVVAWQLWYGWTLLRQVLASPLPAGRKLKVVYATFRYWRWMVTLEGRKKAFSTWSAALRDTVLFRGGGKPAS